jgi:APA family basic amino acid/polyamine antiporter
MRTVAAEPSGKQSLERVLGLGDLVMLAIGATIGSGIFIVPATVLQQTGGNVGLALMVWFAGGVLSLLGALTYGELGAMRPESGGLYVYIRDAFGRFPAFVFGWTLFFLIGSGSIATLAVAFNGYFEQFLALPPLAGKLLSLTMIAVIVVINVLGTRRSANLQNWTTGIKVVAILAMSVALIAAGGGGGAPSATGAGAPRRWRAPPSSQRWAWP